MIADAVARSEIPVRVVIEGAPADAARVLAAGADLVMHPRVPYAVLGDAFHVIGPLGRVGVAHKLRVQVARVIRRPQWEAEVVHGENILE